MSHESAVRQARRSRYGEKIERPKSGQFFPPRGFEESPFPESLPMGAQAVYRDDRPTDSVQIRVYEDRVTYQLDQYNPKHHPLQHALFDATIYTAAFAIGIGIAGSGSG